MAPENLAHTTSRALLTSTNKWPNGARIAMGLSEAGCVVCAACQRGNPLENTRAVARTFRYSDLRPLASLRSAIGASEPQLIVPCDDLAVEHLHGLHAWASASGSSGNALADLIERSLGDPGSYTIASTRQQLMALADKDGIRVPDTSLIRDRIDLEAWRARHDFPWVLKADGTAGGEGVRVVDSLDEAVFGFLSLKRRFGAARTMKRVLVDRDYSMLRKALLRYEPAIIAQRYIAGRAANCAVACWKGTVLAGIFVEVVSSKGPTGSANVVRTIDNPEMQRCAERIVRLLGISGFVGLDFVLEASTGAAFLLEMNPRVAPPCHVQLGIGRDLIGAVWAQVSGNPLRARKPVTSRDTIAYFPDALTNQSVNVNDCFLDVPYGDAELTRALLAQALEGSRPRRNVISRFLGRRFGTTNQTNA